MNPKERVRLLAALLREQEKLYESLYATSMGLREALIQREHADIRCGVQEMEALILDLRRHERSAAEQARSWGFLAPDEPFNLKRLADQPQIQSEVDLREQLSSIMQTARRTARAATINRHLIKRLADWNQNEARILLEPPAEQAGYGSAGELKPDKSAGRTLVDRRG